MRDAIQMFFVMAMAVGSVITYDSFFSGTLAATSLSSLVHLIAKWINENDWGA